MQTVIGLLISCSGRRARLRRQLVQSLPVSLMSGWLPSWGDLAFAASVLCGDIDGVIFTDIHSTTGVRVSR